MTDWLHARLSTFWGPFSRLGLGIGLLAFIIDQVNKWWMLHPFHLADKGRVAVTPFLDLVLSLNKGVSYSFFTSDDPRAQYVLAAFALFASVALVWWLGSAVTGRMAAVGIGLILGGALGNGLDRLTLGGVADFYLLHAFGFHWYVFNIADVAIVAGVAALLYESLSPARRPVTGDGSTGATKPPH
jgi:signal peptidase II